MTQMAKKNETPTFSGAIRAVLLDEGFMISEFTTDLPLVDRYITVPHNLGRVPDIIIAFRSDIETDNSGYQLLCVNKENYGQDNNYNRTYMAVSSGDSYLLEQFISSIPFRMQRTLWNATRTVNSNTVELRNQSDNSNSRMLGTKWYLAVK